MRRKTEKYTSTNRDRSGFSRVCFFLRFPSKTRNRCVSDRCEKLRRNRGWYRGCSKAINKSYIFSRIYFAPFSSPPLPSPSLQFSRAHAKYLSLLSFGHLTCEIRIDEQRERISTISSWYRSARNFWPAARFLMLVEVTLREHLFSS